MNICGDFLQLPPVDKHGTRKSLALPVDAEGNIDSEKDPVEQAAGDDDATQKADMEEQAALENRQGFELWRSLHNVVTLYVNVSAPGALGRFQAEMRSGKLSDEMWRSAIERDRSGAIH